MNEYGVRWRLRWEPRAGDAVPRLSGRTRVGNDQGTSENVVRLPEEAHRWLAEASGTSRTQATAAPREASTHASDGRDGFPAGPTRRTCASALFELCGRWGLQSRR